ncbi:GNAT family N-acetyltransferase [uncultured Sulfitobacter sp.]|uniref:GNAT family N-acetyltransferase n=1 Tax=uncultured Sulfitobacter sp. TaxID=191468 RepID=UPI00345B4834
MMPEFTISTGFSDSDRADVARLYWNAFSSKLGKILGPDARALAFFADLVSPDYALVARNGSGGVIGVAGFKTAQGALTGGGMRDIARHYGWLGALWRGPLLAMLERDLQADTLLMDGICVDARARGMGVGTALLHSIKDEARSRKLTQVRLDVIDINTRARALYTREGFVVGPPQHLGPLRYLFGFSTATPMTWAATP